MPRASKPRWTLALLVPAALALASATCSPAENAPIARPNQAPAGGVAVDPSDEVALAGAVRSGRAASLAALELPLAVSRARVAVHALAEALAVEPSESALVRLRQGVDGLHRAAGGGEAAALTALRHHWRGWNGGEAASEAPLAARVGVLRKALARFGQESTEPPSVADEPLEGAPGSPFFAALPFERALVGALSAGPAKAAAAVREPLIESRARFEAIGWPGGFADLCSLWSEALVAPPWRDSALRVALDDGAHWGYSEAGGDRVALAGIYLRKARELRQAGPGEPGRRINSAQKAAARAVEILRAAGAEGETGAEALLIEAKCHRDLGAFEHAAARAADAGLVARDAGLDPGWGLEAAVLEASCRFRMGAVDAAHGVAAEAARRFDAAEPAKDARLDALRAELDEVAGLSLAEAGQKADAAALLAQAARRHEAAGRVQEARWARLRALDLNASAGVAGAVDALVAFARDTPLTGLIAGTAASKLLDHGQVDAAATQLERAKTGKSPLFVLVAARLAAARGDARRARDLFRKAGEDLMQGADTRFGPPAAEILTHWSRFEEEQGAPVDAAHLAHRAVFHLEGMGAPGTLDRAYARLIRLERARMEFRRALTTAEARRRLGLPESRPGAGDALLDAALVRLEVGVASRLPAQAKQATVEAVAERFLDPVQKTLIDALARAVFGLPRDPSQSAPKSPGGRWDRILEVVELASTRSPRQVANGAFAVAGKAGTAEPELRRFACLLALRALDPGERRVTGPWRRRAEGLPVEPDDLLRLLDLRRGTDTVPSTSLLATLAEDEVFRMIEPIGDATLALTASREGYVWERIDPARALDAFRRDLDALMEGRPGAPADWDALARSARRARGAATIGLVTGPNRFVLSIGKPFGHLPFAIAGVAATDPLIWVSGSAAERAEAATHAAPRPIPLLSFYDSPLRSEGAPIRHAVVQIAFAPDDDRKQVEAGLAQALASGLEVREAFARTVDRLRADWKPPAGAPPAIPAWAAFALRGAP